MYKDLIPYLICLVEEECLEILVLLKSQLNMGIWRCILDWNKRSYDGLIQVSVAINLQLGLDDQYLPFIDPADFDTAKYQDKLFIHGPIGNGKSREKTGKTNLIDLINQFTENDVIVWDNFLDDLIIRDTDNARKALEIISSKEVSSLLVALKPKYLELYRRHNKIPELYGYGISSSREKIRNMIKSMGIT